MKKNQFLNNIRKYSRIRNKIKQMDPMHRAYRTLRRLGETNICRINPENQEVHSD